MTRNELPALHAQLATELTRTHDVVTQLEALRATVGDRTPTVVELMATGGFLHNLYNGVENCLLRVAHGIDESVPEGPDGHRLLVDQMSAPIAGLRPALLGRDLARRLDEYRRFRHAFRHMYFFDLDWERMAPLVHGAPALLRDLEHGLHALFHTLQA